MSALDHIFLLTMILLAAYQIVVGINDLSTAPIIAYTIAFGVLLVAGLLLIILGFQVLEAPVVVIVLTIIPLSLSLGLAWQHLNAWRMAYLVFVSVGFLAVVITRTFAVPNRVPVIVLAFVHGIAGLTIFLLPITLAFQGQTKPTFALVGVGGALIGAAGLLLSFLKTGHPILSRETVLKIFPALLMLTTAAFVAGFVFG
jgi:hypothetical protein